MKEIIHAYPPLIKRFSLHREIIQSFEILEWGPEERPIEDANMQPKIYSEEG
jgi:hypothetical protein